jgi:hypothetical protein
MNSAVLVLKGKAALVFPIALCIAHLIFLLMVANAKNGGWAWIAIVGLDFPISILVMQVSIAMDISPTVPFALFGTAWWFAIGWVASKFLFKISKKTPRHVAALGRAEREK